MNILVFGDSIAAGAFDTKNNGWVNLLAMHQHRKILSSNWAEGAEIVNLSVSGNTSSDLLRRIEFDLETRSSKSGRNISMLAIGTNDAAEISNSLQVSKDDFSKNVSNILDILEKKSSEVIVLGLPSVFEKLSNPWCFDKTTSWKNDILKKYDHDLQIQATERDFVFISLHDLLDKNSDQHLPEGLHPNAAGHQLIFERVKEALEKENIL